MQGMADVITLPSSTQQVIEIINIANKYKTPVIARGSATNTCAATIPSNGGIIISTQNLNKILEINPDDRYAIVEPGVINDSLNASLQMHSLFWPPDPGSSRICTIGGNIACNSAGPSAVKYGVTRDHVLGLTFVTGDGKVIKTGVFTSKGVVGYDLTRLLIGSEGTLGIITEAVLKLTPKPKYTHTLSAHFTNIDSASHLVSKLMTLEPLPSAIELLDSNCLNLIQSSSGLNIPTDSNAMLIIETNSSQTDIIKNSALIKEILEQTPGCIQCSLATEEDSRKQLWKARKTLSPKLKHIAPKKINEDIVVPISNLPKLIDFINNLSSCYNIPIVNFGHAGNGNIHVNILIDPSILVHKKAAEILLDKIFNKTLELRGSISGEHGIGQTKKDFAYLELSKANIEISNQIKKVFDPNNILNPSLNLIS